MELSCKAKKVGKTRRGVGNKVWKTTNRSHLPLHPIPRIGSAQDMPFPVHSQDAHIGRAGVAEAEHGLEPVFGDGAHDVPLRVLGLVGGLQNPVCDLGGAVPAHVQLCFVRLVVVHDAYLRVGAGPPHPVELEDAVRHDISVPEEVAGAKVDVAEHGAVVCEFRHRARVAVSGEDVAVGQDLKAAL